MGAVYKPYFFRIVLPFKVEQDLSKYEIKDLSRFVHEYIHFLQNLYTPWGLFTSFQSYSRMKRMLEEIKNNIDQDILIPYECEHTDHDKWYVPIFTIGEGKRFSEDNNSVDNIEFNPASPIKYNRVKHNGNNKPMITIEIDTIPYGKQEIVLGAWIIKESMAQIIQTSIFSDINEVDRPKVIPYDFVSIFCKQYAPSLYGHLDKLVAICWASLFSMYPGESFMDLVDFAECNPQLSAIEIFDNHISSSRIRIKNSEQTVSFEEFMNDIRIKFLEHLEFFVDMQCDYFRRILSGISIKEVFSSILAIVGNKDPNEIDSITQELGMPIVFGEANSSCMPFLKEDPESFNSIMKLFGIELVYGFLCSKGCKCPSLTMCEKDEGIEKQYECISNPLMVSIDCPMYFAANIVGVYGRNIEIKE